MEKFDIISNNCVGARYYEKEGYFPNPFMWNSIKLKDFIYLIKNFDKINLLNIKSFFTSYEIHKDKKNDKCSTILLDDIIKIYYLHHHYDEKHLSKKVFRNEKSEINFKKQKFDFVEYDISGSDILDYLENCWYRRLKRFNKENKKIFVYWDSPDYNNDDIKKLFELNGDFIIIVISEEDYSEFTDNSHFYIKKIQNNTITMANILKSFLKNL